jgi:hypothetical protein
MKHIFTALIALLLTNWFSLAQKPQTWWMSAEFSYGWTLKESGQYSLVSPSVRQDMGGFNVTFSYQLSQQLSVGAGIGAAAYSNLDLVTIPLSLDVRYRIAALRGTFVFANVGVPLSTEVSSVGFGNTLFSNYSLDYKHGFFTTLGVGYRVPLGDRWALRSAISYQVFPYAVDINNAHDNSFRQSMDNRTKQGLLLHVGVEYSLAPYRSSSSSLLEQRTAAKRESTRRFWLTELFLFLFFGAT